jgi:LysM repeat protein
MVDHKQDDHADFIISKTLDEAEAEELRHEEDYGNTTSVFRKKSVTPYIIGGAGFIVLLILLITSLSGGPRDSVSLDQLQSLDGRIQALENLSVKMGKIEEDLARIENQEKETGLLKERVNQFESTVASQIDQIIKELGKLHQKTTQESPPKAPPSQPAEIATPPKESTAKFHEVRAGETLYSISRSYGLSVEQLRTYNQIGPDASIQPGQKLKLSPGGKN